MSTKGAWDRKDARSGWRHALTGAAAGLAVDVGRGLLEVGQVAVENGLGQAADLAATGTTDPQTLLSAAYHAIVGAFVAGLLRVLQRRRVDFSQA